MKYYKRSFENWSKVRASETVGCYYCLRIQPAKNIKNKCEDKNGFTAICTCGIDSVVPFEANIDETLEKFQEQLKIWNKLSFQE